MNRILLMLVCLAAHARAFDEKTARVADDLVTTMQAEIKDLAGDDGDNNQENALRQYLRQVKSAISQGNGRSLDQYLDNLGNYDPSEKVKKGIEALKKAVQQEFEDNTRAVVVELRGLIAQARENVTRAAEPEDLDKVLASLSRNRTTAMGDTQSYDSNDATVRALQSEMNDARQFVTTWQDYLQASNAGDSNRAVQSLKNLAGRESSLIPRSAIIARMDFEQVDSDEIAKLTGSISTPDGMKGALVKLTAMLGSSRSSSSDNQELRETVRTLARLEKTYREFLAGLPVSLELLYQPNISSDPVGPTDFVTLRAGLLLLVLPRCLDLPVGFEAEQDESVDHFLKRALDDAGKRADTAAARRIQDTRLNLVRASSFNQRDQAALGDHAAGLSQLAAGQYALAVVSLQKALASGSDLIPATSTGETLTKIKQEHAEEFEQGMMEFLTPRPTPEFDYSRMPYRNYMGPRSSFRDGDPRRAGGTTIVLPVPAKDAAPKQPENRVGSAPKHDE